jgi:predicted kinase
MDFDGLVVVAGIPGSGKTTLARDLAIELHLPLISKDTIKESLFDVLGTGDLDWSRSLGRASHQVMYAVARETRSAVLESHFWRGVAEADLVQLKRPMVQVYCRCPNEVALLRYKQRASSPERHPGHLPEHQSDEVLAGWSTVEAQPLALDGPLVEVDTSRPVHVRDLASRILAARATP